MSWQQKPELKPEQVQPFGRLFGTFGQPFSGSQLPYFGGSLLSAPWMIGDLIKFHKVLGRFL
jgi:hypothetical protein